MTSKIQYTIIIAFLMLLLSSVRAEAQRSIIYDKNVKSLKIETNNNWAAPPVIQLGSDDYITISFDVMTHKYIDLRYRLIHCNADWKTSELYDIDYMDGFNDNSIENYTSSINTTVEYTNYSLSIPNDEVSIKTSGNYLLEIYDYDTDEILAAAAFSVVDKKISVGANVTSNTVVDTNKTHQQVDIIINHPEYNIRDPRDEIKVCVVQNGRFDNMVQNLTPSFIGNSRIEYKNDKSLIFKAGNEFRRFEILNENDPMMGVDKIGYFAPYYHVTLLTDRPASNYNYDQDQNGKYIIRNNNAEDSSIEADYMIVHFTLDAPYLYDADIYLDGEFTNHSLTEDFKMIYNPQIKMYEKSILLKQGIYNYQYLTKSNNTYTTEEIEGDFYETSNNYIIYVYHRPFGERYDKLIGISIID